MAFSRLRYSPQAHEDLNTHVNGLIHETHAVEAVRRHLEESEEFEGTAIGLAPGSIQGAKAICKDVLKTRLRESASDCVFAGRKVPSEHINKFGASLGNAQACGWLDSEVQFTEFQVLYKNYQVRSDATQKRGDHASAESLLQQLQAHIEPVAEGEVCIPLTDKTLATLLLSILVTMRKSPEACKNLANLGIVDIVSRLFSGEGLDYKVQAPNPDFPEVQMCLAGVLVEVALQSAREASDSVQLHSSTMRMLQMAADIPEERRPPAPPEPPPISDEAQCAIKALLVGLKESLKRSEHSAVWAVITALQRLADHNHACRQMLAAGFLPVLRMACQNYSELASSGRLPLAIPRPKPRPPAVTKEVPSFVGAVAEPPALHRQSQSVKERWSVHSHSMPALPAASMQHSADWLAGSPVAKAQRKRQPNPLTKAGHMAIFKTEDPAPFPSLLWLIGEDSVDKEAFYRVCDRSFMMLQIRKLLRTVEQTRARIANPPYLRLSPPPSRGIMGGSRNGSRGGSRGRSRQPRSNSMVPAPAKGSDMYMG